MQQNKKELKLTNNIVTLMKRLYDSLLPIRLESLDDNLLDMHPVVVVAAACRLRQLYSIEVDVYETSGDRNCKGDTIMMGAFSVSCVFVDSGNGGNSNLRLTFPVGGHTSLALHTKM